MLLVTTDEMRALDEATIRGIGVPGVVLMESAGRAVVDRIAARRPLFGLRVAVVCGPGNNGGDGFVVARHLVERGADVRVALVAGPPRAGGDADVHYQAMRKSGVVPVEVAAGRATDLSAVLARTEVIVDAILGTGATAGGSRPVEGHLAEVVERINAAEAVRIAVDLPTGLDADRGQPAGACVRADETVTFGFAKLGLVTAPGYLLAGAITVADIGIPARLLRERGPRARLLDDEHVAALLPPRPRLAHKGTFGHLLVVAGSVRHAGAALLSAHAGLRAGAGLVTLATFDEVVPLVGGRVPEASLAPLGPAPGDSDSDGDAAFARLEPHLAGKAAVAFGPGLGQGAAVGRLLEKLLARWSGPLVIDADGLNVLATRVQALASTKARVVVTPHPAEMARLLATTSDAVQADRVAAARRFAERTGAVVALKGARTVIARPAGLVGICPTGNPGMASGGTGDALTGVVGALLAGDLSAADATEAGVYLHGRAGDLARDALGEAGLVCSDLIERLPAARAALSSRA